MSRNIQKLAKKLLSSKEAIALGVMLPINGDSIEVAPVSPEVSEWLSSLAGPSYVIYSHNDSFKVKEK